MNSRQTCCELVGNARLGQLSGSLHTGKGHSWGRRLDLLNDLKDGSGISIGPRSVSCW